MTDAALKPSAYSQVRIREPAGERTFSEALTIGGAGADVVVPGVVPGVALQIERRKGVWVAEPAPGATVRFDGRPLTAPRDLRRDDVLAVGDAQLIVTDVSRTLLRLDICHLVGNATIAPAATVAALAFGEAGDEDLEIRSPGTPVIAIPSGKSAAGGATGAGESSAERRRRWLIPAAVAAALLLMLAVVSMLESVPLDILPSDARVRTPGTLLALHSGARLLVLPGKHVVRAEREGYVPAQADIVAGNGATGSVKLRLAKMPGKLHIDTGGIPATVSIDGLESGRAPGDVDVPAGQRTITLRAPRHVDYIASVAIEGAGVRQDLKAVLQPSWGTLKVSAVPTGAHVSVDGAESGVAPASIAVPSGVRRVEVSAPGMKTWESSVVVKAGETLAIGPITLGQPDAHLTLRSTPSGAEVTVAGAHRGRTPLEVDLPAGIEHQVVVNLPGFATWTRPIFADSGRKIALDARLEAVVARVTVQGEPTDAELLIDGASRGHTPQSLNLSAVEHRIEVRKQGFLPFTGVVTPAAGLERTVQYHLTSADRSAALQEAAPTVTSKTGSVLRLVPSGTFVMGSERREQGRRPNEGLRQVTLKRPFYFGVTEVTNAEFRKFRSAHASGFIDRHSIDLDTQPVTQVTWEDAAEYCNWLSEQDGLPPAYEKHDNKYVLKRPVTTGYRLPTEAEWEYAARYAGPNQVRRFAWGDALPVADQVGNLAGAETAGSLEATLPGYRDEYPVVAPVGKFLPTPLGLHDMSGNVSEWINDYYLSFVDSASVTDPLGPEDGGTRHVVRGANWKSAAVTELRLAWRDGADAISPTLGFRVARYAE
jgi:formylglycine-generating enzyme required for sulfatase activity